MNGAAKFGSAFLALAMMGGITLAQDVWPLERYDRWGTGKQPVGPSTYTQPWKLYKIAPGGIVSCGAAIDANGVGYFSTWQQNRVYRFDVSNGAVTGSFNALRFVASMPVLGQSPNLYAITSAGAETRFFEINRISMDFNWFQPTSSPGQGDYYHAAALVGPDQRVYLGNENGQFRCFLGGVGTNSWTVNLPSPIFRTPVFTRADDLVVVSAGNTISGIAPTQGRIAWTQNLGSRMGAPGASPSGTIVVGNDMGTVYGLSPSTGAILWTRPTLARVWAAPAFDVVNSVEVAYVTSEDQSISCIRISDGVRLWTFGAFSQFRNPPIVDNLGFIYCQTASGALYKISPQGAGVWQLQFNGTSRGPMSMGNDGTLFLGFDNHDALYALKQTPSIQSADNFILERGSVESGSLVDTHVSDDQYLTLSSEPRTNAMLAQFILYSPANSAHKLRGRFELSIIGSQKVASIQLFNFNLNRWDLVSKGKVNQGDSAVTFNIPSNAGNYVSNGNSEIRIRLEVAQKGGEQPTTPFAVKIDEARFELEPVFQL